MNKIRLPANIPQGSVLGLNYSGMHDTAMALVAPDGEVLFALSLERLSRVKQDGGCPNPLLQDMPWDKISSVALSVAKDYEPQQYRQSKYHKAPFDEASMMRRAHGDAFMQALDFIPVEKKFVEHHLSHAASAFWLSGFSQASCLVYDGGMANEDWFGGVYSASQNEGISTVDQFNANVYSNIAHLYTGVTILLGFTPLKHEGKITGLAAYGNPDQACIEQLESWLSDPSQLGALMSWENIYGSDPQPRLKVNSLKRAELQRKLDGFSREDIAATVQNMAEERIVDILKRIQSSGDGQENLCLAGGLFANVKINQRASELGFKQVFIAPPMSDDGTALGAALHVASSNVGFKGHAGCSMFLGSSYTQEEVEQTLIARRVNYQTPTNPAAELAKLLSAGKTVAVFQGASEFGPRSLGGRSILASADNVSINAELNKKLNRTEFMPFAPVCLAEDASWLFKNITTVKSAVEFMTVTVECTGEMAELCPAVVHCDQTARPQLVTKQSNALVHGILQQYKKITKKPALVNTSFNVHEEPIVLSPDDAIKGFFETGLDVLFIEGHIVSLYDNVDQQLEHVRAKLGAYQHRLSGVNKLLDNHQDQLLAEKDKSVDLQAQVTYLQTQVTHLHEKASHTNKTLKESQDLSTRFSRQIEKSNERVLSLKNQMDSQEAERIRRTLKGRIFAVLRKFRSAYRYYRENNLLLTFKRSVGVLVGYVYTILLAMPWLRRRCLWLLSLSPFLHRKIKRLVAARRLVTSSQVAAASVMGLASESGSLSISDSELNSPRAHEIWQDLSNNNRNQG